MRCGRWAQTTTGAAIVRPSTRASSPTQAWRPSIMVEPSREVSMSGRALLLLLLACGPKHPLRPPGSPTAPPGTAAGCPSADLPLRALPADAVAWPDDTSPEIARVWGTSITEAWFRAAAAKKVPRDGAALSAAERQEVLDGTLSGAAEPTRSEAEALALALNQQIVLRPHEMKDLAALY